MKRLIPLTLTLIAVLPGLSAETGEPFIPVFFDGGKGRETPSVFKELEVFRECIPAYVITRAVRPFLTPFRHAEGYPSTAYAQRNPDDKRRKTPYTPSDLFEHPELTVDSPYARSGKPFFIYEYAGRPPFFMADETPLADRAGYAAWLRDHAGFLGYNCLWELDNDTAYFLRFWDRIPDDTIRHDLHTPFGEPDAVGLGHLVRWTGRCFDRAAKFHFGDQRIWPLCSYVMGYEHIFAAYPSSGLWYEASAGLGAWNAAAAYVRGAARQHGLPFGWYMAQHIGSYKRSPDGKGTMVGGDSRWCFDPDGNPSVAKYRGESRSLHRRQALYGWLVGAKYEQTEGWVQFYTDMKDGVCVPSENALDFDEIYRLSKRTERGEPFTPLAILTPLAEPLPTHYSPSYFPRSKYDVSAQRTVFDTLVPMRGDSGLAKPDRMKGEQGSLFNSEFGGMFDALVADGGQPSSAFARVLARYRHVLVVGSAFDSRRFDHAALSAFEKSGGRVHRYPSPEVDTPEKLRALLLDIQRETMPVTVEGDIQWGVNRTQGGWLVYLINNKGVVKFADEPESFDAARTAHVTVTLNASGERQSVDVAPGDFALLTFKAR